MSRGPVTRATRTYWADSRARIAAILAPFRHRRSSDLWHRSGIGIDFQAHNGAVLTRASEMGDSGYDFLNNWFLGIRPLGC
jgi:hypothetical protein